MSPSISFCIIILFSIVPANSLIPWCTLNSINCTAVCGNNDIDSTLCSSNTIHCPVSKSCNLCDISCTTPNSCNNVTIFGHYCKNVFIHALDKKSLQNSIIHAPTTGNIRIIAKYKTTQSETSNYSPQITKAEYINSNIIYSNKTNSISIDCYNGTICSNNIIYGQSSNSLQINIFSNVGRSWCDNNIYCPVVDDVNSPTQEIQTNSIMTNQTGSCSIQVYSSSLIDNGLNDAYDVIGEDVVSNNGYFGSFVKIKRHKTHKACSSIHNYFQIFKFPISRFPNKLTKNCLFQHNGATF